VDGWVCLVLGGRDRDRMIAEVGRVFGDDLVEVRAVAPPDDSSDSYCFVKCSSYLPHVGELVSSPMVRAALPSYEHPQPLTDDEVNEFCASLEPQAAADLSRGDLVKVRDGYLSGLFGIVLGPAGAGRWSVLFRFHIRDFEEKLAPCQVEVLDNVFRRLRTPVTSAMVDSRGMRIMAEVMGSRTFREYMAERRGVDSVRRKEG